MQTIQTMDEEQTYTQLIEDYEPLLRTIASDYDIPGVDFDDLLQEARQALVKAHKAYDPTRGVPFPAFCALCVRRKMQDCLRAQKRKKHEFLNRADSIDDYECFQSPANEHPEWELLASETISSLKKFINRCLTSLEKDVLTAYLAGESYETVAKELQKSEKSVDNALHRARSKLAEQIKDQQLSLQAVLLTHR